MVKWNKLVCGLIKALGLEYMVECNIIACVLIKYLGLVLDRGWYLDRGLWYEDIVFTLESCKFLHLSSMYTIGICLCDCSAT